MPSDYPDALDNLLTDYGNANRAFDLHPELHNDVNDAVNKMQGVLGVNPAGPKATVKEWLEALEAAIELGLGEAPANLALLDEDGKLKETQLPVSVDNSISRVLDLREFKEGLKSEDDITTPLEEALTEAGEAGRALFIPEGVFGCGDLPALAVQNVMIVGAGAGGQDTTDTGQRSCTQITHTGTGSLFQLGTFTKEPANFWVGTAQGFRLENIRIAAESEEEEGERTKTAIQDNGSGGMTLRNVAFKKFKYAIAAPYGSDFSLLDRIHITDCDVGTYFGPATQQLDLRVVVFNKCMEAAVLDSVPHGRMAVCSFLNSRTVDVQFERLQETRFGLKEPPNSYSNGDFKLDTCWHESGNGSGAEAEVQATNGHIRTYTDYADKSYPRGIRVINPRITAGGPASETRSFWECATGKFLYLKDLVVNGAGIRYGMNRGEATKMFQKNIRTIDGYPEVQPYRNSSENTRYVNDQNQETWGVGSQGANVVWRTVNGTNRYRWRFDGPVLFLDYWHSGTEAWLERMKFDPQNGAIILNGDAEIKRTAANQVGTGTGDSLKVAAAFGANGKTPVTPEVAEGASVATLIAALKEVGIIK